MKRQKNQKNMKQGAKKGHLTNNGWEIIAGQPVRHG
jgi:hypothetical protein